MFAGWRRYSTDRRRFDSGLLQYWKYNQQGKLPKSSIYSRREIAGYVESPGNNIVNCYNTGYIEKMNKSGYIVGERLKGASQKYILPE